MTQHTPTLWKVTMDKDKAYIEHNHGLAEDYWTIAQVFGPQQQANAEFIVRACNSHDVLLAALKAASQALTLLDPLGKHHDALAIDEALNHAEGRP